MGLGPRNTRVTMSWFLFRVRRGPCIIRRSVTDPSVDLARKSDVTLQFFSTCRLSARRGLACAFLLLAAPTVFAACSSGSGSSASGSATSSASAPASTGAPTASTPDNEREPSVPEPVYPRTNDPPDPLATRFCDAIHTLPAKRKAECCKSTLGFSIVTECVRTLTYALKSKAIALDPGDVDRCTEAIDKAHEGCDWVTPLASPVPAACLGIVKGTVKEGARCRSALECEDGLSCHGVAASDTGVCGKPKPSGACGRGLDTLASHTRQTDSELKHPECAGHCNGRRCEPDLAVGAECKSSIECGTARLCIAKKCSDAALPAAGSPCLQGACGEGARCMAGKCTAPKKLGEACADDIECAGACEKTSGAAAGRCAMLCSAKIPGLAPSPRPASSAAPARK